MDAQEISRRKFLTGGMHDTVHISSAVISVLPNRRDAVLQALAALPEVEVHQSNASKIVIVLEGPDSGALGARLAEISSWRGVLSANMVFEQTERAADLEE
ncbi:chaperone NapD [Bradyrhizobium sp. SYSU BS000235]|uniref:chaperone NapD n=1 Tax=Bradyrhizobium sp. SYSU BS000235 TaxID=3411332 RepID=UPI003C70A7E5